VIEEAQEKSQLPIYISGIEEEAEKKKEGRRREGGRARIAIPSSSHQP
jgi:hypothetical protein